MRILFEKISDERHRLQIVRSSGDAEDVVCESRSTLVHDFLHFAVEKAARLDSGFWGNLAKGKTLADMNDRTGQSMATEAPALMDLERIVGALSNAAKGRPAAQIVEGFHRYCAALETPVPEWLTERLVTEVKEQLRRIQGAWKGTPFGASMELEW